MQEQTQAGNAGANNRQQELHRGKAKACGLQSVGNRRGRHRNGGINEPDM